MIITRASWVIGFGFVFLIYELDMGCYAQAVVANKDTCTDVCAKRPNVPQADQALLRECIRTNQCAAQVTAPLIVTPMVVHAAPPPNMGR